MSYLFKKHGQVYFVPDTIQSTEEKEGDGIPASSEEPTAETGKFLTKQKQTPHNKTKPTKWASGNPQAWGLGMSCRARQAGVPEVRGLGGKEGNVQGSKG